MTKETRNGRGGGALTGLLVIGAGLAVTAAAMGCGSSSTSGASGDGGAGSGCDGSGFCIGSSGTGGGSGDGSSPYGPNGPTGPTSSSANGTFTAPDCPGCTFPPLSAGACGSSAPTIKIVYPSNGVLVPPNMNSFSVQWTPFGGYSKYEVDFSNSVTDTRIITKCATQTMDTSQPPRASGGCDLEITPAEWALLVAANRGSSAVTVTVRGTTDGTCASSAQSSIKMSFASEDILGAIYYWKSTISAAGTGGQIWEKSFGDQTPEQQVTGGANSGALSSSCNGCHVLSRDGQRMVIYSDDDDSDDEYSDVKGSVIDMATKLAIGGTGGGRVPGLQPPGFSTISPSHTLYLTSDGLGTAPTNNFTLWSGTTGMQSPNVTFGMAGERPTMPDWSPDGSKVIYALPSAVASWASSNSGTRTDDDHAFGSSLWVLPYSGNSMFGTPAVFLQSKGENNYYPSYSPDGQFVVFDRAPASSAVATVTDCTNAGSPGALCPNDSFSNPAARLMLISLTNTAQAIDLQKANGSPAAAPQNLSNSWPRWSPFVQTYNGGNRLLWLAFSSTRDYGVLVRNHLAGMYQCYPADSYEQAGATHGRPFDPLCQQPKLWMAAVNLSDTGGTDPSFPAFYLPFQDITTHNHTPQWTQEVVTAPPPPDAGACIPSGGSCAANPGACCAPTTCGGLGTCMTVIM
jgi:hypothetical protein